jgi:hypothetical protein
MGAYLIGHASHRRAPHGMHLMGVHSMGVSLMGVSLIGVHSMGVYHALTEGTYRTKVSVSPPYIGESWGGITRTLAVRTSERLRLGPDLDPRVSPIGTSSPGTDFAWQPSASAALLSLRHAKG